MKIIFFADRLPPFIGGMETHAHYFIQFFKDKYDLTVVSRKDGKDIIVDYDYNYERYISLSEMLSHYRTEKSVVFFNSGRWIEELFMIRDMLPNAVIMYRTGGNEIIQASLSADMPIYEERKAYWREAINSTVDYLITNSEYTDRRLLEYGIKPDILRRIAGGIDATAIREAAKKRDDTRQKYEVSEKEHLCVSCARFVPYKRPDFLISALGNCRSPIKLILAGDGPLMDNAMTLAQMQSYNIAFLGSLPQNEALELIAAADVYVQTSTDLKREVSGGSYIHTEGMGRSLLEAICLGVPVVVTDCGAVSEYISEENGAVVNTDEEIAQAIDGLISGKKKLADKTEEYIRRYSFESIFEGYIKLWK